MVLTHSSNEIVVGAQFCNENVGSALGFFFLSLSFAKWFHSAVACSNNNTFLMQPLYHERFIICVESVTIRPC